MKNSIISFPNLMKSQINRTNRYITQMLSKDRIREMIAPQVVANNRFQILKTLPPVGDLKTYLVTDNGNSFYCGNCGKKNNKASAIYCTSCGFHLQDSTFILLEGLQENTIGFEPLVAGNLHQNGILTFFELFFSEGHHYVLGQSISGKRLSDLQNNITISTLLEWVSLLAKSMTFLHNHFIFNVGLAANDIFFSTSNPRLVNFSKAIVLHKSDKKLILADLKNFANTFLNLLDKIESQGKQTNPLREILMNAANGQFSSFKVFQQKFLQQEKTNTNNHFFEPKTNSTRPKSFTVSVGMASDVGIVRTLNEDSLAAFEQTSIIQSVARPFGFFMVADGMGGHEAGEEASKIAVEKITRELRHVLPGDAALSQDRIRHIMEDAVFAANEKIYQNAKTQNNGMGTTITIALLIHNSVYIFNVGDGRAYHIQNNKLKLISQDHSLVYRLYKIGQLQYDDILTHPQSNQILCALGESQLKLNLSNLEKQANHPYFFHVELEKGDGLLLCTDGLWQMIREPEIENTLIHFPQPQKAVDELVKTANINGGVDNISLIYISTH